MQKQQMGIYCLTNTVTGMKFINSTKNLNTYKSYLIKKLDNGIHKNLRLLKAWKKYKEFFEFEVLEEVEEPLQLSIKKEYWINYYRSNEVEYGYNLEMYKRHWEKERKKWRESRVWEVNDGIQDYLNSIIKELDYSIEFSEDRVKHLNNILKDKEGWLIDYISSPLFCEKQIKNKKDILVENDISLIGLSIISDYLIFPKYKNKEEKKAKEKEKHPIRKKKSTVNMNFRRGNEKLFGDKEEIESDINSAVLSNSNQEPNIQKIYNVVTRHNITDDDLKEYPSIKEIHKTIKLLKGVLGQDLSREEREKKQKEIVNRYGSKQLAYLKKMLRDLSTEILIMKDILSGTIYFKRVTKGTTVFDYDNDTGYLNENGDYIDVSENKIDFSKEKHILELLNHYSQLKQRFYDQPDSDMWAILYDLDNLIEKIEFEEYIKDILIMKIDGHQANVIIEEVKNKYGLELTEDRVSRIYNEVIPRVIVETYLQEREDWIFTYRVKGEYKTCIKCKYNKLAISKYFGADKRSKDGLDSRCKQCERERKRDLREIITNK